MVLYRNFVRAMENYAVFEGRSTRSEFWWFLLATIIVAFLVGVATIPLSFIPYAFYLVVYAFVLVMFTPTLAVIIRRLHDTGRSALWSTGFGLSVIYDLAGLLNAPGLDTVSLPVGIALRIYSIVLIVFVALPGENGDNRYGAAPR